MSLIGSLITPPWIQLLLAFLKDYWKPIFAIVVAIVVWLSGNHHGHSIEKAKYEAILFAAHEKAQNDHDALQSLLNKSSADFEKYRAENEKLLDDAERELLNEISTNPSYSACHVGAGFMQSYSQLASGKPIIIR